MSQPSRYHFLFLLPLIWVSLLAWIDLRNAFGSLGAIAVSAAVLSAIVLLLLIERSLVKSRNEHWMSRYHLCLAIAFGLATLALIFFVIRFYA